MLKLIIWIIENTSINDNVKTSNKEIKEHYLKCFPDAPSNINFHIGAVLSLVYGKALKKYSLRPVYYNLELHQKPIKKVIIKDV